jgi:spore maturation protein A
MLNKIWFALLVIGIVYGFGKGAWRQWNGPPAAALEQAAEGVEPLADDLAAENKAAGNQLLASGEALTNATLQAANLAVEICLGLIGVMVLWLGMLNVAKDAGLVDALARALAPLMRWLFPGVPDGHPAGGAMIMNIAANMLGLDNAATPFGLKAMKELQTLNPTRDTATDAMAMFLAINTSNVTLLPISIIALRVASGSEQPARPIAGMFLATLFSTIVAVIAARYLARRPAYAFPTVADQADQTPTDDDQ